MKKKLAIGFWIFFAIYSVYWGTFYWVALDKRSLIWVDLAVSAYFAFLIVLYLILGVSLIKVINKNAGVDEDGDEPNAPGVSQIVWILVLQCIAMFLRMIFVSLQDINKVSKIDSINKGSAYWDEVMTI